MVVMELCTGVQTGQRGGGNGKAHHNTPPAWMRPARSLCSLPRPIVQPIHIKLAKPVSICRQHKRT
jgi:hypothetical protein